MEKTILYIWRSASDLGLEIYYGEIPGGSNNYCSLLNIMVKVEQKENDSKITV